MLTNWLAILYAPLLPFLKNINIRREGARRYNPGDILLPEGYTAELVAGGLNAPTHCTFDNQGNCYVSETGHKIHTPARIIKINLQTGRKEIFHEMTADEWNKTGALTGACWHDDSLYFTNTDTLARIKPDGQVEALVSGLPGLGDHQTNYPLVGPDGKIYFGQGCVTNCGVVGSDNFAYEWLAKYPQVCDVPAQEIVLTGHNYSDRDVLDDVTHKVTTGAFVPFGTPTTSGQVIAGNVKCSGAILRCNPDGSDLEVVAWGLRNSYGLAFHPNGRLYATEHGMDERGHRFILDDPDDLYAIEEGEWYGWPDFASGIRLDDPHWGEGGRGREPVMAQHPNPSPPKPVVSFETHCAANGVDICRDPQFGFEGEAFVACFGDLAPLTTLTRAFTPAGFKVVRVDLVGGQVYDFAVNRIAGPASKLPHAGFERPAHCQFGPDGTLYVVDFGIIKLALEKGGIREQAGSGALWRIRRTGPAAGQLPASPKIVPLYLLQYLAIAAGLVAAWWAVRRAWRFLTRG